MHKPPTGAECTAHSKTNAAQFNARNSLACSTWEEKWQLEPNMLNHEKCITSTNTNTNTHCQTKQCHSSPSSSRGEIVLEPAELTRVLLRRSPHKRALIFLLKYHQRWRYYNHYHQHYHYCAQPAVQCSPGLHKLWYVLISWADQGSRAHFVC